MLNLSILLEDSARAYPDRDALVLGSNRLTYRQVDAAANQVANLLVARGIRPGDKVALSCPNLPYFPIVYYGVLKAGAVVVPLNVLLKGREIAHHLDDADVSAYFCFEGTPELAMGAEGHAGYREVEAVEHFFVITADPEAPSPIAGTETLGQALAGMSTVFESVVREPTDTAVILYTSGTTGQPKGAELSHANTMMNVLANNRLFRSEPAADSQVVCLPLFHTFGATVQMHAGFSVAATLHLVPRFDARAVVELMNREVITFFAGVPTMWWGLLGALTDDIDVDRIAANLRIGISGGAALPVEILNQVEQRLGITVLEGYGLSETSPVATFSDPRHDPRPGSIGVPIWGVELKLIRPDWTEVTEAGEVGEIAVRGHNVMKGYYNRPEETAEAIRDGWFRTGDLARRDEDGFYYIVDRVKDLIIRGGYNVYPREIEEVLLTHPAVSLAAVIGVPHDSHGEEIKAFVIPEEDSAVTAEELIAWGKEQMAAYKYPRIVELVPSLPMTGTGKILKRELT
ncbi:long-chain fatty acid--CoA ligase [Streptomyces sp. JJ38]|uniref:long-chain-fatty-acid--CoA ligase n=1 Tax=Streptomyces sp. JJ38 TaxID=2738128 RepID=UPI001C567958|nr:long-chain fatty acid--CoA ligase [Streptomyces sp. JJ38]MBW1595592.1 long-chain fatty acid--CoA ligase [Streptomyces sp. JJ38]